MVKTQEKKKKKGQFVKDSKLNKKKKKSNHHRVRDSKLNNKNQNTITTPPLHTWSKTQNSTKISKDYNPTRTHGDSMKEYIKKL